MDHFELKYYKYKKKYLNLKNSLDENTLVELENTQQGGGILGNIKDFFYSDENDLLEGKRRRRRSRGRKNKPSRRPSRSPNRRPPGSPNRRPSRSPNRRPPGSPNRRPSRSPNRRPSRSPNRRPPGSPRKRSVSPNRRPPGSPNRRPPGSPRRRSVSPNRRPPPQRRPSERPRELPDIPEINEIVKETQDIVETTGSDIIDQSDSFNNAREGLKISTQITEEEIRQRKEQIAALEVRKAENERIQVEIDATEKEQLRSDAEDLINSIEGERQKSVEELKAIDLKLSEAKEKLAQYDPSFLDKAAFALNLKDSEQEIKEKDEQKEYFLKQREMIDQQIASVSNKNLVDKIKKLQLEL